MYILHVFYVGEGAFQKPLTGGELLGLTTYPKWVNKCGEVNCVSDQGNFSADDDDDVESSAESRARRIEELAKKFAQESEEVSSLAASNDNNGGRGRRRSLHDILGELDTVSERSELDDSEEARLASAACMITKTFSDTKKVIRFRA